MKSRKEIWWRRGEGEVGDVRCECLSTKGVPTTETLWLFFGVSKVGVWTSHGEAVQKRQNWLLLNRMLGHRLNSGRAPVVRG